MTIKRSQNATSLALVLLYSLAVICWGVVRGPLSPGEARTIFMGREIISSGYVAGGISSPALDELIRGNLGSAAIAPAVLAAADAIARIYGARLVCGALGLLLVCLVFLAGNIMRYGKRGLLTAVTFVFLGVPLQLSSCASADVFAAVFLGASLWWIERAAESGKVSNRREMLLLGALSIALAVMTSYLTLLFLVPFILFIFLRHHFLEGAFFFAFPVLVLLSFYGYFAVLPVWPVLEKQLIFHLNNLDAFSMIPFTYVFSWLTMPFLLATVGIFHRDGRCNSFFMTLLAAPALLIPFVSADVNDAHTVVLLAMILLAPATALGVVHMADIFTANNNMELAKVFFVSAILIIIWVFGVQQMKELRRECPDLSPAVAFLRHQGAASKTVLVDSDYGSPEYVYDYYLADKSQSVGVLSIARADERERKDFVMRMQPRYVVVDGHHSARSFNAACRDYLEQGFTIAATYNMSLVSGDNIIKIFQKGAL